jgi:hypothetical protein
VKHFLDLSPEAAVEVCLFEADQGEVRAPESMGRFQQRWLGSFRPQAESTTRAAGKRLIDAHKRDVKIHRHLLVLGHD